MKIVFGLAALPLVMALVSADCWSDLRSCRVGNANLQVAVDQCQEEKAQCTDSITKSNKEAYCWECAYKEVQACMDATTGSCDSNYAVCYPNALKIREKCLTYPSYTCGEHFRSFRYQLK
ncbi:hypothetical protein BGZ75_009302 [Mortierella antarctica]|nr:hypothetical protein BGZ75_009302 [Mortierella antarctica]